MVKKPNEPYRAELAILIARIERENHLAQEDSILILHSLNSKAKAAQFKDWVKSRTADEHLNAKAVEIVRAAVRIGKGQSPDAPAR